MAWPFSGSAGNDRDADTELAEERLKIMANVAIEQVPLPEQGELSEEDAWTISPDRLEPASTVSERTECGSNARSGSASVERTSGYI